MRYDSASVECSADVWSKYDSDRRMRYDGARVCGSGLMYDRSMTMMEG